MDKNNKKDKVKTKLTKEKRFNIFVFVVVLVMLITCIGGCCSCISDNSSNEEYIDKTRRAFYKEQNGEDLTREEREALDNYDKWLEKQEDK